MNRTPLLRRYWFHGSNGLGIGATAPDATAPAPYRRRTDAVPTPFNVALDPPMRFMQKLSSRPAWFMAEGALDRLPPGTTLSRQAWAIRAKSVGDLQQSCRMTTPNEAARQRS
jgi:hypothetical protein